MAEAFSQWILFSHREGDDVKIFFYRPWLSLHYFYALSISFLVQLFLKEFFSQKIGNFFISDFLNAIAWKTLAQRENFLMKIENFQHFYVVMFEEKHFHTQTCTFVWSPLSACIKFLTFYKRDHMLRSVSFHAT